jgi:protein-tyrosine kinase
MSRLEDALNRAALADDAGRAGGAPSERAIVSPVSDAGAAPMAPPWQFDGPADDQPLDTPQPPAPAAEPLPAALPATEAADAPARQSSTWDLPSAMEAYEFGDLASGKTIVGPEAESCLVEQYRRLAASLHHAHIQKGVRSVMVTSAVASEGKTLTATNLALTLSQSYKRRVLLIDADLRRPTVHEVFRTPNAVGLGDVLRNPEVRQLPLFRLSPTLWILTAGRPDSDPMSGLVSEEMKLLLSEASEHFDWVIVDTPPVALLSDANLLASMIDTTILVIGASSTPFPMVRRAVDAVGAERILGVVLNRIDRKQMVGGYGYYDYYGYKADPTAPPEPAMASAQAAS